MRTLTIATGWANDYSTPERVECVARLGGLAVTRAWNAPGFALTHIASGLALGSTHDKDRALEALRILAPLWDWKQSNEILVTQMARDGVRDFFGLLVRDALHVTENYDAGSIEIRRRAEKIDGLGPGAFR